MATVIKADGTKEQKSVTTLEQAREVIGGYVTPLWLPDGETVLLADEDGLPKRLPINDVASILAHTMLVGTVVVLDAGEVHSVLGDSL